MLHFAVLLIFHVCNTVQEMLHVFLPKVQEMLHTLELDILIFTKVTTTKISSFFDAVLIYLKSF